jgi:hypothetical protein
LKPFESFLNLQEPHCAVLAASEGFSFSVVSSLPQLYLKDAHPIFFPSEELICGTIGVDQAGSIYRSFLLVEICSPSRGLLWSTKIGFAKFKARVQVLGGASTSHLFQFWTPSNCSFRAGFLPSPPIPSDPLFLPATSWRKWLQHFHHS